MAGSSKGGKSRGKKTTTSRRRGVRRTRRGENEIPF